MKIPTHTMPRETFASLARGEGDTVALRQLAAAQYSKHRTLLHGVLRAADHADRFAVRGYQLLAEVERYAPEAAAFVISYPSVGAWAVRTIRGDRSVPGAEPAGLSAVAAAAAIRAGLPAEIEVRARNGSVMLPSLGAAAAAGETAVVRTGPGTVLSAGQSVHVGAEARGWQGLRGIHVQSLDVLVDDLDPFRMPAADGLAHRLTTAETDTLAAAVRDAWPVLDPRVAAEITQTVRVIIPRATPRSGHTSSTSPETFGAVAMSRPPDRYTCAATLVHEVQHLKLGSLLDFVTLALPDDGRCYYAPWRHDPRPIGGLLQGAYAFLGISGFWRSLRLDTTDAAIRLRAETEFARWRAGAGRVTRTLLSSGRLTPAGEEFVGAMSLVLDGWRHEPVSETALADAQRLAAEHYARWSTATATAGD